MKWSKRIALALPFVVAASLNITILTLDKLHLRTEHVAGYGFLFAAPWGWLIDHDWHVGALPAKWVEMGSYALVLWIPALLYSLSLWLLISGATHVMERQSATRVG